MTSNILTFQPFALGQIVATRGALASVPPARIREGLSRHARGDWGTVCAEDGERNTEATREGLRIVSAYPIDPSKPARGYGSNVFWIITEADRSATTILLPDEYGSGLGVRIPHPVSWTQAFLTPPSPRPPDSTSVA